jgi:hypothetical protein
MSKAPRARAIRKQAQRTAARERAIQRRIDRKDKSRGKPARKARAMQAGTRKYPVPKFPRQHLRKPGREADLALAPMYEAPDYRGSGKLRDKVALVTRWRFRHWPRRRRAVRARGRRCRRRLSE